LVSEMLQNYDKFFADIHVTTHLSN
jgi:hypothetical protein